MNSVQKQQLYSLLQAFLSIEGYTRTQNIMEFEYLLKETEPGNESRVPGNYFAAFMDHRVSIVYGAGNSKGVKTKPI